MGADAAAEEQFGPYLVYERLGVGGMATVHRALERGIEGFERIVALKRLLPHLAEDASFIKSFVREAKLASYLNHVNIVQIFELGRVGTEYFISMEYIDGRDIRRILRHARKVTGPPPIHVTVGLLLQLCDALDYAHAKTDDGGHPLGLVHRDVSPSNLLVTSAGHLKVIDFGIAKAQSSQLRTQTGRVKGKLAYMAPEAISGKDLDARSDLFAAGVIAHELLTARPLFASKNEYQTLLKVQRGDIMPPSTFNQGCPPELDAIVLKALARDPDERFGSAGDLREELLVMRKQYNLQTSYRDVATWLDWAFSLEVPTGGFAGGNTMDQTGSAFDMRSQLRTPTPLPNAGASGIPPVQTKQKRDEEEAVEMAWGGGEEKGVSGPVVLDEVPDVSEKHLAAPAAVSVDVSDLDDDIPTPQPSHGAPNAPAPATPSAATPAARTRSREMPVVRAHTRTTGRQPTITIPPRTTGSQAVVTIPPVASGPVTGSHAVVSPVAASAATTTRPVTAPLPTVPAAVAASLAAAPQRATPPSLRRTTAQGSGVTPKLPEVPRHSKSMPIAAPIEDAIADALDASADRLHEPEISDTLTNGRPVTGAIAAVAPTHTPQEAPALDPPPSGPTIATPADERGTGATRAGTPSTLQGHQPPRRSHRPTGDGSELFAEPDPDPSQVLARRTAAPTIGAAIAARSSSDSPKSKKLLLGLAGLVVVGGAATGVAMMMKGKSASDQTPGPTQTPQKTIGTVKFVMEPADAVVTIEGKPAHTGSPWAIELPAGVHQIEIHRDSYKGWLTSLELAAGETQTLRVVLEPLGAANPAASADATLVLSSTPAGLETFVDGQTIGLKTPLKYTIKPGTHVVTLRQNGVDVWRKEIVARASSDYELNPTVVERSVPRPRVEQPPPKTEDYEKQVAAAAAEKAAAEKAAADKLAAEKQAKNPGIPPTKQTGTGAGSQTVAKTEGTGSGSATSAANPANGSGATSASGSGAGNGSAQTAQATQPTGTQPVTPPVIPTPPRGPVTVAPSAVTRTSGEVPNILHAKNVEVPPVIVSKLCIDESGRVSSVNLLTKLEAHAARDVQDALRIWKYQPYKQAGVATPACFVVNFKTR